LTSKSEDGTKREVGTRADGPQRKKRERRKISALPRKKLITNWGCNTNSQKVRGAVASQAINIKAKKKGKKKARDKSFKTKTDKSSTILERRLRANSRPKKEIKDEKNMTGKNTSESDFER